MSAVSDALKGAGHHPLVVELVDLLPAGGSFTPERREKWLGAAKSILDLVYDEVPVTLTFSSQAQTFEALRQEQTDIRKKLRAAPVRYSPEFLTVPQQQVMDVLLKMKPGEDGWISTPVRAIQRESGTPSSSINSILDALEKKQLIKIERNGGNGVNRYMITAEKMEGGTGEQ